MNPLDDPRFRQHTFVVIDFEAATPAGRPPEPIEVAAIALTAQAEQLIEAYRFSSLIRPPDDVPLTAFDTQQTGITTAMLTDAQPAEAVMADLDARLTRGPCRLVAHNAACEAGLIARRGLHCPTLAEASLLDTVILARRAYPDLSHHRLDDVLRRLQIPCPPDRHRALADVEVTVEVFRRVLADGAKVGLWSSLNDLDQCAGRAPTIIRREVADEQRALF